MGWNDDGQLRSDVVLATGHGTPRFRRKSAVSPSLGRTVAEAGGKIQEETWT
jgi:hypothetical protein